MDDHEDSGVGPRGERAPGMSSEEPLGAVDPLTEGAPVGSRSGGDTGAHAADGLVEPDETDAALPLPAPSSPHAWVNAATAAGLGLMVVELLVILGTIAQGLAIDGLRGDLLHKVGAAFTNVEAVHGLTIVAAAVLVALPVLVGAPMTNAQQSRRALALALGAILALLLVLATPIAVRARLHLLDLNNEPVNALTRRFLGTYTIGTLGTAAVALGTCLGLARASARRPDGDDSAEATTADDDERPVDTGETVSPHP